MSQAGLVRVGSGAAVLQTLTGDTGGAVGPDGAFNINLLTDVGLTSTGNPGTNTITFSLDGAGEGTVTTVGNVTANVLTLALGGTPATFTFEARIAAFEATTPAGVGYQLFGVVRTTGAAATIIGTPDVISNEEAALTGADIDFTAAGNTVSIVVEGVAGLTMNWRAFAIFTRVT